MLANGHGSEICQLVLFVNVSSPALDVALLSEVFLLTVADGGGSPATEHAKVGPYPRLVKIKWQS